MIDQKPRPPICKYPIVYGVCTWKKNALSKNEIYGLYICFYIYACLKNGVEQTSYNDLHDTTTVPRLWIPQRTLQLFELYNCISAEFPETIVKTIPINPQFINLEPIYM